MNKSVVVAVMLVGTASLAHNSCVSYAKGYKLNNTEYADGNGPRTAKDAESCCAQCIGQKNCKYWSFQVDEKVFPGVKDCKWAHLTYCCYFHTSNTSLVEEDGWSSGGFTGVKPAPTPAPPPPGPCATATQEECGKGSGPYLNGSKNYCENACAWNSTKGICETRKAGYPMPSNASLQRLTGVTSPLKSPINITFYGDSITWLGLYQGVLRKALKAGAGTRSLQIDLLNQGVNGGTVSDLVAGFSPWGHLDPHQPQTNISFVETLKRDMPDLVAVQIGVNDVLQWPKRGNNVTVYESILQNQIVRVVKSLGIPLYLATISLIGEETDANNRAVIQTYAAAAKRVGAREQVPVIDLFSRNCQYEAEYNCLDLHGGLLTGAGVHPYTPQGQMLLANAHADGIMAVLEQHQRRILDLSV